MSFSNSRMETPIPSRKTWRIVVCISLLLNLALQFVIIYNNEATSAIFTSHIAQIQSVEKGEFQYGLNTTKTDILPSTTSAGQYLSYHENHTSSPVLINCGCPESCNQEDLYQRRNGNTWTCAERIESLMKQRHMQEQDACLLPSSEMDAACGSGCNPQLCQGKLPDPVQDALIIASVPRDEKHVMAVWTELECIAATASGDKQLDLVLLSVPQTSRHIVEPIVARAHRVLKNLTNLHVHYNVRNDRYDVGMWCNALMDRVSLAENASVVLLNDSVFVTRHFPDIFNQLHNNASLDLVGLSYSNSGGSYWIESVMRGFSATGVDKFIQHSCHAPSSKFCRDKSAAYKRKRCIVEYFEIGLVSVFDSVWGLYPSDPPPNRTNQKTWVQNPPFWNDVLVRQLDFPIAKVNQPGMIGTISDPRLHQCSHHIDLEFIRNLNYTQLR